MQLILFKVLKGIMSWIESVEIYFSIQFFGCLKRISDNTLFIVVATSFTLDEPAASS